MDMLEGFTLVLLLEATGEMKKDNRAELSYDWDLAASRAAGPEAVYNLKKLHRLVGPPHFRSVASNLGRGMQMLK